MAIIAEKISNQVQKDVSEGGEAACGGAFDVGIWPDGSLRKIRRCRVDNVQPAVAP